MDRQIDKHRDRDRDRAETEIVKACCTAPSLNPNMNTQVRRPSGPETTNESAERLRPMLAEPCKRQCRVGGWVSIETAGLGQG